MFHDFSWLPGFQAETEAGDQPTLLPHVLQGAGLPVWILFHPHVSASSLSHQTHFLANKLRVRLLFLRENPGHRRGRCRKKDSRMGLRWGNLWQALRKQGHSRLSAAENGGSGDAGRVNESLSNSLYGDQSEDKGVIGKEGAVLLFSQGRGCGVGGRSDGCLLSPLVLLSGWPRVRPEFCESLYIQREKSIALLWQQASLGMSGIFLVLFLKTL